MSLTFSAPALAPKNILPRTYMEVQGDSIIHNPSGQYRVNETNKCKKPLIFFLINPRVFFLPRSFHNFLIL